MPVLLIMTDHDTPAERAQLGAACVCELEIERAKERELEIQR